MIFSYDLLYSAWKASVVQSSTEYNKAKFKYFLEPNLMKILDELQNDTYMPAKLRIKRVYYPKVRDVQVPSREDKIVQHAMCDNYLTDALMKPLIKETSACITGRGTLYASELLKRQLHNYHCHYGRKFHVLKCDISKYFASIPHDRLYKLIDRYVDDKDLIPLIHRFVEVMPDKGLALGLQQSQLLANLYLSSVDHLCKEKLHAKYYGRYMDDFYIISNDLSYLLLCQEFLEGYVETLGLHMNPKTGISSDHLDFLGFTYQLTDTGKVICRVRKDKNVSKRHQFRKLVSRLKSGEITADEMAASFNGWRAHVLHGNSRPLVLKYGSYICAEAQSAGYELIINDKGEMIHVKNNR